jgi:hypothetical protein
MLIWEYPRHRISIKKYRTPPVKKSRQMRRICNGHAVGKGWISGGKKDVGMKKHFAFLYFIKRNIDIKII